MTEEQAHRAAPLPPTTPRGREQKLPFRICGECRLWIISWPIMGQCIFKSIDGSPARCGPSHQCFLSDKIFYKRLSDWDDKFPEKQLLRDQSLCAHNEFKKGCNVLGHPGICHTRWKPEGSLTGKVCEDFTPVQYRIEGRKVVREDGRK